jgi:hypothetical protein
MTRLLLTTDLGAGVVGAALLLVLVFVLHVPLLIAITAAIAVYLMLRIGLGRLSEYADPARLSDARAITQCEDRIADLTRLTEPVGRLTKPDVYQRITRIVQALGRIAAVIKHDPDKRKAARPFLELWVKPIQALLEQYVRLSTRGIKSAQDELTRIEQADLPMIEDRLAQLYEDLHRGDLIDLEVGSETLSLNLREIDVL